MKTVSNAIGKSREMRNENWPWNLSMQSTLKTLIRKVSMTWRERKANWSGFKRPESEEAKIAIQPNLKHLFKKYIPKKKDIY